MPLVKVVFPVPRSPVRRTSTGGWRRLENSLPQLMVSSAEWVMNSSATEANLPQQVLAGPRDRTTDFRGQHPRNDVISFRGPQIRVNPAKIASQDANASPLCRAELRVYPRK